MKRKWILCLLPVLASLLLAGCNIRTVEDMYKLPKRSEEFTNLQSVMDKAMTGLEYSAPISGEHQQTVQMSDLDGDGNVEYILFAKGTADKPLQIFIFSGDGESYALVDTIECSGTAFEQVEYVRLNDRPGYEMVVGRQVSDEVLRSVTVYTMAGGQMEQLMTANYSKFLCSDMDTDGYSDLLILRPDDSASENGVAELYSADGDTMARSEQVNMSAPADKIKRIILGKLHGGLTAAFVASHVEPSAIITDVYAVVDGVFTNVSFSNESGTSVQTLRNYYVYADDIDSDGILELPSLITMRLPINEKTTEDQYIIRWYAMTAEGGEVNKLYTYHNFVGGWYLELDNENAERIAVSQKGNSYEFGVWDKEYKTFEKLMTVYVLTGQKREEQAHEDNRFVLHRSESTVYAAKLEVASSAYDMTKDNVIKAFHLILQDWKTGET